MKQQVESIRNTHRMILTEKVVQPFQNQDEGVKTNALIERDVLGDVLYMDPCHEVKVRVGILEQHIRAGACLATHPSVP